MTGQEAVAGVHQGMPVKCTKEEYEWEIRNALQDFAGKCIDYNDAVRAQIALQEVKRLDEKFGTEIF